MNTTFDDLEGMQLEANLLGIRMALNGEQARVKFIRDAAMALIASGFTPTNAWSQARAGWDAKPEDC